MSKNEQHGNKHVKVTVRYTGRPAPFNHNYLSADLVGNVKAEAMQHFGIVADPTQYCLHYEDKVLNDAMTLRDAGLPTGSDSTLLELVAMGPQDTDGGEDYA